ncbi:MAG: hypothetical protein L6R30_03285 [Thermoanaerobaculia bacterium]|nr:hypothetical protein [Thermoanaerobaculia bacterium]
MLKIPVPFRALFLLRNNLENIQVVPLGSTHVHGNAVLGGVLQGREELLSFVREVQFDSIVESYQVTDLPHPSFLRTFHLVSSPETLLGLLDHRLVVEPIYAHRVLSLEAKSSPEQLTLAPHEAFQLGSTVLSANEGIERVSSWFRDRARSRGEREEARANPTRH